MKYDSRNRKLLKGELQRDDGMYVYRLVVGGKRRVLYSMSLPELRKKEKELKDSIEKGIDIDLKNTTLNDLAEEYIRDKKKTVQITTYQTMEFMYRRYIKNTLGKQVLGKIKRSTVKQHYLNLSSGDHRISINHAAAYVKLDGHYRHIIKRTKSVAGDRDIPMLLDVRKALLDQKWRQEVMDINQPIVDGYTGFVFLSERDRVYTRENISAQVKQVIREYNENTAGYKLPEFSTHQLRHTFATRLCRNSSDLKSIQKILGHKDISTTMNIYADATEDGVAESMQALEGVMFRKYNSHKLNN